MAKQRDSNRRSSASKWEKGFSQPKPKIDHYPKAQDHRPKQATRKPDGIRVECSADYKGEQEPRVVIRNGVRLEVVEIAKRWREPDAFYFRVCFKEGPGCLLRRDIENGAWTEITRDP